MLRSRDDEPDEREALEDQLRRIQEAAEQIEEKGEVPFDKLFPEEFMNAHTGEGSLASFFRKAGWTVRERSDLEDVPRDELDRHVREHTEFASWDHMQSTARTAYIKRTLRGD